MTANLPVVADLRAAAVDAQARNDPSAANRAYALELQALAGEAVEAPAAGPTVALSDVSATEAGNILAHLARHDPEGAAALQARWGVDMAQNLAYGDWLASKYLPAGTIDGTMPDAATLRVAAVIGRGAIADLRSRSAPPSIDPVPAETAQRFVTEGLSPDERPAWAAWRNSIGDGALRAGLAAATALLRRYSVAEHDWPESLSFWKAAVAAAPKIIADLQAGASRATAQPPRSGEPMADDTESFANGMRGFEERIARAQAEGNSRLANKIYQDQQAWIATVKGAVPVIGSGGRYS